MPPPPKYGVRFSASGDEAPPNGSFAIRAAVESDAPAIMDGFNATFGAQRPAEYWGAKFNAAPPPAALIAVDTAGKVYAQFSGYPATLNNRGRSEAVLFAADVFARRAVAAIREGVFPKVFRQFCIDQRAAGRFAGMIGFPNARVLALYQTTGYIAHASEVGEFAFDLAPRSLIDRWLGRFGKRLEVKSFSELTPEFLAAAETIASTRATWNDVVEFSRPAAWVDWRYRIVGRHYGTYGYHLVSVRNELAGWIITRRSDVNLLFIDWRFASNGDAEVLGSAFTAVLRQSGAACGVALMSASLRAEFRETLAWRPIGSVPFAQVDFSPWALDATALSLNYGDTDLR